MKNVLARVALVVSVFGSLAGDASAQSCNLPIIYPSNGANNVPRPNGTVTLKWATSSAASGYDVYLAEGTTCPGSPTETVVNTTFTPERLEEDTQYAWRVEANGSSACTPCVTFTTAKCPTEAATLLEPREGEVPFGSVTFKWTAVPNATSYQLHALIDQSEVESTVSEMQKTVVIDAGREILWWVTANAPGCDGVESGAANFTTSCPDEVPELQAPERGETFAPSETIHFAWSAVPGAAGYDVQATPDHGETWITVGENLTTRTFSDRFETGDWGWTVRANFNGGCEPRYADPSQFYVAEDCPTQGPGLESPEDDETLELPIAFVWSEVERAQSYKLWALQTGDELPRLLKTTTETSHIEDDLSAGEYEWWVVASFEECDDTASERRTVTVESDCPDVAPQLLEPDDGEHNVSNPVTFEWSEVASARLYRLYVRIDEGSTALLTTTEDTTYTASLDGESVEWTVEAVFDEQCTAIADSQSFTLDQSRCPADPDRADLLSPADGATNLRSPVTFRWEPVAGAIEYRLLASIGGSGIELLGVTDETTLEADLPIGTGYWLVQTLFGEDCPTTLSERRDLTVTSGAQCSDAVPNLISPPNGATDVASAIEFKWSAVDDATGYVLFVDTGEGEFSFYGKTEETSLERLVPEGTIRWFVVAEFAACPETHSSIGTFVVGPRGNCEEGEIELNSPEDGAEVNSPVLLSWSEVAGAEMYRVWVSSEDSAPVKIAQTTDTETTVNLPGGKIVWYVEAQRGDCPPILSNRGEFEVIERANCDQNGAPILISPAGSETDPANASNPVTLSWSPVSSAIGYRVWISAEDQPFGDVDLTDDTSLELELDPGLYRWYVEALFEGCRGVPSDVAFFKIAETEPRCPTEDPVAISPSDGSSVESPVTFVWSEVEGADAYRVFVSTFSSDPVSLGVTTDTQLTHPLPPGTFYWLVQAIFRECPSTFSERTSFTIEKGENCDDETPQLVAPPDGENVMEPSLDFVWNPVNGAIHYVLMVQAADGAPTAIARTEDTEVSHRVPPGKIEWWVVAFFPACDPVESDHFTFDFELPEGCDNRRPILLQPPSDTAPIPSPIHFAWTSVPNAVGYNVWVRQHEEEPSIVASTGEAHATVELAPGPYIWFVEALFEDCPSELSGRSEFIVGQDVPCGTPEKPRAQVVGQALSGTPYQLRWTPLANVGLYEIQEATSLDFSNAESFTTNEVAMKFEHEVSGSPVQYLYRVRGVSDCNDERGPYSNVVGVFVVATRTNNASAEAGENEVIVQTLLLPGSPTPVNFIATADKPWLTIDPAAGVIDADGVTLNVSADPEFLELGTNTGTVMIEYLSSSSGVVAHATTVANFPMSVSLVTPVTPVGKGTPPPDALIFPAVGHAVGANDSLFESDIRVTNLGAQTAKYELHFTPSGVDGTQIGSSSTIEIAPNATLALDDIVASLFGTGTVSSAVGMLEVRPITTSGASGSVFTSTTQNLLSQFSTVASSRTYNFTPTGTFGQYIPAIPFSSFVGKAAANAAPAILSLQQVAQSAAYRANFGFAEASGNSADLMVRVYDTASNLLTTIPVSLKPSEHIQLNGMLALNGITNLTDGRVEVEVVGGEGKVTAYVSEVDNQTNDPLMVSAVVKGSTTANRYTVPGVALIDNGLAFWVSDVRIFNAGSTSTPATLTFYPMENPAGAITREITLAAGEIEVINNILGDLFAQLNGSGGSMVITTPAMSTLTATARTYNQTSQGTYGQYIPGVTAAESVGAGERALQILQLEQSTRFRTNVGVAETTGAGATVEISAIAPDSLVTPVVTMTLAAGEFRQIPLAGFNLGDGVYNARVTVKVISGAGRVTAYGSAIDQITQDPTYVPAQ